MNPRLIKTLFIVLPLTGLLITTLGACTHHHRRSPYGYGATRGDSYGYRYPDEERYDEHRNERDRRYHDGDRHRHDHGSDN